MSVNETITCPICKVQAFRTSLGGKIDVSCPRCGHYRIGQVAIQFLAADSMNERQIANASAWIREHQDIEIKNRDLPVLRSFRSPSVHERAMRLLQQISREWPAIGQRFEFMFHDAISPHWLSVSWATDVSEFEYLICTYLRDKCAAIEGPDMWNRALGFNALVGARITPAGHELLAKIKAGNPESPIGFCAMWFDDAVKPLWTEAIEPAIAKVGYKPVRIDQHEHVNRIDDEIIATIRSSRFVVADFTGQRGGVYFEAGYALGLGLSVIWLCNEDHLKDLHFDTRQYNFLLWKHGQWSDIARRLQHRIEATLGRGPIHATA